MDSSFCGVHDNCCIFPPPACACEPPRRIGVAQSDGTCRTAEPPRRAIENARQIDADRGKHHMPLSEQAREHDPRDDRWSPDDTARRVLGRCRREAKSCVPSHGGRGRACINPSLRVRGREHHLPDDHGKCSTASRCRQPARMRDSRRVDKG